MNAFDIPQEVLRTPDPSQFLRSPEIPAVAPRTSCIEFAFSDQLRAYYQHEQRAMWSRWNPLPRPCFRHGYDRGKTTELSPDRHAFATPPTA